LCVTIEPGVYFSESFIDPALADPTTAKFFDVPTLERYRSKVGGVRIEDDVIVTEDGIINLSTPYVPTSMEEIEALMALA
jgi:Xaa-Pro dipeptidase